MKRQEWTFIDKSKWPLRGAWDSEPDKVQWQDAATGLPCLAVRALSHWCGYVGVPREHPLYGKSYDDVDVDVHGGLTFADRCQPEAKGRATVCHVPEPGEPEDVWWFGFDCVHSGDRRPPMSVSDVAFERKWRVADTYRSLVYVEQQVTHLAAQLKRIES